MLYLKKISTPKYVNLWISPTEVTNDHYNSPIAKSSWKIHTKISPLPASCERTTKNKGKGGHNHKTPRWQDVTHMFCHFFLLNRQAKTFFSAHFSLSMEQWLQVFRSTDFLPKYINNMYLPSLHLKFFLFFCLSDPMMRV